MLAYPPIGELLEKSGAKEYTLVIEAAKRARELNDEDPVVDCKTKKPVSNALEEVLAGRLKHKSVDEE
ncbi:DNA-directed RNA polymerase subunit omega [Acetohalobium arabaticum]|uniref:DNA-directed RNA polymerase subunit omega n=1 Tax=Acetohalobium arabaticum (strain ATCC 49924 / DSM 5501 / Z-7288) TaxID=574087 RepID=D9QR19_ACEAZ|nr:DNA-directed RNA polymerase subunit omega [Acetohalobium arabaticum]ADL12960.1 DNA-directed RNA polymerase, omega subunit [Acetohalobium arabaticum DSM 5501]